MKRKYRRPFSAERRDRALGSLNVADDSKLGQLDTEPTEPPGVDKSPKGMTRPLVPSNAELDRMGLTLSDVYSANLRRQDELLKKWNSHEGLTAVEIEEYKRVSKIVGELIPKRLAEREKKAMRRVEGE